MSHNITAKAHILWRDMSYQTLCNIYWVIWYWLLNRFLWFCFSSVGSQYWRQNARKILAVPEQDFNCLQGTKRKKLRYVNKYVYSIG